MQCASLLLLRLAAFLIHTVSNSPPPDWSVKKSNIYLFTGSETLSLLLFSCGDDVHLLSQNYKKETSTCLRWRTDHVYRWLPKVPNLKFNAIPIATPKLFSITTAPNHRQCYCALLIALKKRNNCAFDFSITAGGKMARWRLLQLACLKLFLLTAILLTTTTHDSAFKCRNFLRNT